MYSGYRRNLAIFNSTSREIAAPPDSSRSAGLTVSLSGVSLPPDNYLSCCADRSVSNKNKSKPASHQASECGTIPL